MSQLLSVKDALQQILADVTPLPAEDVALADAAGRVLAEECVAKRTQPPFPASAMDGYAARTGDLTSLPTSLTCIGESAAGHRFKGTIGPGQCVRIFTGAPVPPGADTIVIQENVNADNSSITVLKGEEKGRYIRPAGLDFTAGDTLLTAGQVLNASTLSLAAAMNHPHLPVRRRPVVAIIATGDELVLPGQIPNEDQIIASNGFGVAEIVRAAGGTVLDLGIAIDTLDSLREKFNAAEQADIVITLGGASVGDHDLVVEALGNNEVALNFWKLAMRPGKPVMFGKRQRQTQTQAQAQRFIGLPGNPVSSLVCAQIFISPLIHALLGHDTPPDRLSACLAIDLAANDQREEYMRAIHEERDGTLYVTPYAVQDSSILSLMAKATCLMVRPAHAEASPAGSSCEIILL